ncbi:MAG: ribosome silencing factor [Planctomycetes bacterium]|nr:ribosome silencing factor [Planctomycetota bacterium]
MTMSETEQSKQRPDPAGDANDGLRFAVDVARIAADNRTGAVAVLDLRGLSNLTDFFVIGTGTSDRQMRAVLDLIAEHARQVGRQRFNVANTREATWILADYIDVVVHLFDVQHREYYDLDSLWGDAPQIAWQRDPAADNNDQSPTGP